MLSIIMLSVIMLNIVAPSYLLRAAGLPNEKVTNHHRDPFSGIDFALLSLANHSILVPML
jgi:hypothetical protein